MKERKQVKENSTIEYRTTKEVIEGIVRNSDNFSIFNFKTIFTDDKMFYCVRLKGGDTIYEVKVTRKKRINDEMLMPDNSEATADMGKKLYLAALKVVVGYVFPRVNYHEGNILVNDNNNDYVISLIKKMKIVW
jgi:hypothetical protein